MTNYPSRDHIGFLNFMWWYYLHRIVVAAVSKAWHAIRCYFSLILVTWHIQPCAHCFCKCNGFYCNGCCLNYLATNSIFQIYHFETLLRRSVQKCWPIIDNTTASFTTITHQNATIFQINDGKRWKSPGGIPRRIFLKNTFENTSNELHSWCSLLICKKQL